MADVLPGFLFTNGRYRNESTGRFVSRADINGLLDSQIQSAESRLQGLATAFYEGKLAPAIFVEQVSSEERRLALQNSALAKGGFDRLGFADYGRAGQMLRGEYQRIIGTARDVQDGKISLPQLLQRMTSYAGDARVLYFQTQRNQPRQAAEGMTLIQRRLLAADAQHCADCENYYGEGWQPIGNLPAPGEACRCRGNCRCSLIEREVPTSDLAEWLGSRR
jgi:hypothetical protein